MLEGEASPTYRLSQYTEKHLQTFIGKTQYFVKENPSSFFNYSPLPNGAMMNRILEQLKCGHCYPFLLISL